MKKILLLLTLTLTVTLIGCDKKKEEADNVIGKELTVDNVETEPIIDNNNSFESVAYILEEVKSDNENVMYKCVLSYSEISDKLNFGLYEITIPKSLHSEKLAAKEFYKVNIQREITDESTLYKSLEIRLATQEEKDAWTNGRDTYSTFDEDFTMIKNMTPADGYKMAYDKCQYTWSYAEIEVFKTFMEQQMQESDELKKVWTEAYTAVGKTLGY